MIEALAVALYSTAAYWIAYKVTESLIQNPLRLDEMR